MKENQDTSFFKEVKKKLIDLDMTFSELRKRTSYSTDWGLRKALKNNNQAAVDEVQKILVKI
jgi:putative uncharacterized protein FNV2238|nr:MAG TPA: hypothetical protein [Caudoviricetes sp.]